MTNDTSMLSDLKYQVNEYGEHLSRYIDRMNVSALSQTGGKELVWDLHNRPHSPCDNFRYPCPQTGLPRVAMGGQYIATNSAYTIKNHLILMRMSEDHASDCCALLNKYCRVSIPRDKHGHPLVERYRLGSASAVTANSPVLLKITAISEALIKRVKPILTSLERSWDKRFIDRHGVIESGHDVELSGVIRFGLHPHDSDGRPSLYLECDSGHIAKQLGEALERHSPSRSLEAGDRITVVASTSTSWDGPQFLRVWRIKELYQEELKHGDKFSFREESTA